MTKRPEGAREFDREGASVTRTKEELAVGTREVAAGRVRLCKWVETEAVQADVKVRREDARIEREPINEPVSGAEIGEEEVEAELRTRWVSGDVLRLCKRIDGYTVKEVVERLAETVDVERVPVADGDSGEIETLPDGTISIPLLEEELVIETRVVVRERVLVRRCIVEEETPVGVELRRERLEIKREPPADNDEPGT